MTTILEKPMGRKKKEQPSPGEPTKAGEVAVKYDRVLAEKLKQIVQRRGGTMAKYLSELTRIHIEKEYAKVVREMADELEKPKGVKA